VCSVQSIQSLMLDDLKLKTDLNVLLGALGSNTTLTELDIRSDTISINSFMLSYMIVFTMMTTTMMMMMMMRMKSNGVIGRRSLSRTKCTLCGCLKYL